ncbi:MAG: ABC transporter ATP-binding protein [Armatimonadetes bacterium]|nr:ABC transporter ATP-binding protein [Armatimonadota bacterium]
MPPPSRPAAQRPEAAPPIFGRHGPGHGTGPGGRAKDARGAVLRLWGYVRGQQAPLVIASLLAIATTFLGLLGPFLMTRAIDRCIIPRDLTALSRTMLMMLAAYVSGSALTWVQGLIMAGVAQRTFQAVRSDLFAAMQRLPVRYFDTKSHGDLMSRLTNDVEAISRVMSDSVTGLVAGVLGMVGAAAMMLSINAPLALATMLTVVGCTLVTSRWLGSRIGKAMRAQQGSLGALNGIIEETLGGQKAVIAYRRQSIALEEFDARNAELRKAAIGAQMYAGYMGPFMNGANNICMAVVAGLGGLLALRGAATVGAIAGFISYARYFGRPLAEIGNLYGGIQGALAAAERVFEVMDEQPEEDAAPGSEPLALRGEVTLDNVCFGYEPDAPVLKDVSLHAEPGETVALIGPTGAGKTTVINLLTRFYDVDTGRILIDGRDIRELPKAELRRQVALVLQDPYLFAGDVRENIRYGRLDATDDDVVRAAEAANAHGFIERLPHGYETHLSERGSNLSQGQRQLISIARAILADPRLLILDEATSSVDTRTEQHIQQAMARLMEGRTSFVIAHRLSTIRKADQILYIRAGRICERGNHAELMALRGEYWALTTGNAGEAVDEERDANTPQAATATA